MREWATRFELPFTLRKPMAHSHQSVVNILSKSTHYKSSTSPKKLAQAPALSICAWICAPHGRDARFDHGSRDISVQIKLVRALADMNFMVAGKSSTSSVVLGQ